MSTYHRNLFWNLGIEEMKIQMLIAFYLTKVYFKIIFKYIFEWKFILISIATEWLPVSAFTSLQKEQK